jgi:hypothetical protein
MVNISTSARPADVINALVQGSLRYANVEYELKEKVLLLAASTYKGFCQIPKEYHTPQAEALAAKSLARHFYAKYDGGNYAETALAMMHNGCDIRLLHPEYLNDVIIIASLKRDVHPAYKTQLWLIDSAREKLTIPVCNYLASLSVILVNGLHKRGIIKVNDLNPESLCSGLINEMDHGYILADAGRSDILSMVIEQGHWPDIKMELPASLEEAIESRMLVKTNQSGVTQAQWLNAYIANHPPVEVANLMRTKARRAVLLEIFQPEQLIGVIKDDKSLNGALLEHVLGL